MNFYICPLCRTPFHPENHSLICENRHCFDLSKRGYVNFLRPTKAGARHGDDKQMVLSRAHFLDAGHYTPLQDAVCEIAKRHKRANMTILDAGCGEGYYTEAVKKAVGTDHVYGIDVSKDAIHAASLRDRDLHLACASIFDIPVENESIDLLMNLFAPYDGAEFARILKKDGLLLRVFPAERHLWELKQVVYDVPYENEIETMNLEGFEMEEKQSLSFPLSLRTAEEIDALFKMTPYYYKTARKGQARLAARETLDTQASFYVVTYRKI